MRTWAMLLAVAGALGAGQGSVRGRLAARPGGPGVETTAGRFVHLDGDEPTRGVLRDARLAGFELQAQGRFTGPDRFEIAPIHTRAIRVHKDGKLWLVTYWCDVCSIRTWTPGKCWCCQQETALDLRDPDEPLQ